MTPKSQSANGSAERQLALTNELLASGIPVELHDRLHYRPVSARQALDLTGHAMAGWTVEFLDINGRSYDPPFHRLKPVSPAGSAKYLTKKDAGCRPYFSPLIPPEYWRQPKDLFITEGEKKADALSHHGFPAVSLSGVHAWLDHRSGDSKPLPELLEINWLRWVFIVFDSDITSKESVRAALEQLCLFTASQGASPRIVQLPCELNGTKNGADDFLIRYGRDAFQSLVAIAEVATGRDKKGKIRFIWKPEPSGSHLVATTVKAAIGRNLALRPGVGIYRWGGRCWERLNERSDDVITDALHEWLNQMNWLRHRPTGFMTAIAKEISGAIKVRHWEDNARLAFANGTLDVASGTLFAGHDRNHHLTFCFPFNYAPGATCNKWQRFLDETFEGDQALIRLLRAAMRVSLMPKPDAHFKFELFFDFVGPKGCGKGTISEILKALVGRNGFGLARSKTFSNPNALAALIGKKVAIDQDAAGHIDDCGVFNSIASNEQVQIKLLYENITDTRLGCYLWRFFNDAPSVDSGGREGMSRRNVTFVIRRSAARPDENLKSKLLNEIPGIFWWVWSMDDADMEDALRNRGQIESVRQASIEAQLDANPHLRFLLEKYPHGAKLMADDLYAAYRDWSAANGHRNVMTATKFGKELKKVHGLIVKSKKSAGFSYTIGNSEAFDWAEFFRISVKAPAGAGLNRALVQGREPNHAPPEPLSQNGFQEKMHGVHGFSQNLCTRKSNESKLSNEEVPDQTLQTLHTLHLDQQQAQQLGSGWDAGQEGDDPHWPPRASDDLSKGRPPC